MENIISKIIGFISKNDIPVEISPWTLKYKNILFLWGHKENPKFEISPYSEPERWIRNIDNEKFYISVKFAEDSEIRTFSISDTDRDKFLEFLKIKYAEWDVKRLSQIESVLNG